MPKKESKTMANRDHVDREIYVALEKHNLEYYTDALMDLLDDYVDWEPSEPTPWVDVDIHRDIKKDNQA